MFDEDLPARKKETIHKNLTDLGIVELEEYIADLKSEILRAEKEIEKKKLIRDRASSVFK